MKMNIQNQAYYLHQLYKTDEDFTNQLKYFEKLISFQKKEFNKQIKNKIGKDKI